MYLAKECLVALFLAVAVLRNPRIYVGALNSSDVTTVAERVVNEKFCFGPILRVPYV